MCIRDSVEVAGGVHGHVPRTIDCGDGGDGASLGHLTDAISIGFGDIEVPCRVHSHTERAGQAGTGCRSSVARGCPAAGYGRNRAVGDTLRIKLLLLMSAWAM